MAFENKRELRERVAELEGELAERVEQEKQKSDYHTRYIKGLLGDIVHEVKIAGYPSCPETQMTPNQFNERADVMGRRRRTVPRPYFRVANMRRAVGLEFVTHDFLEFGKHKLFIPERGDPEYVRRTIFSDAQKCPTPDVQAVGIDEIVAVDCIELKLGYCLGAIAVEQSHGWKNAFTSPPVNAS